MPYSLTDLGQGGGDSTPHSMDEASGSGDPHVMEDDWLVSSVDGLQENSSGPYCVGDQIDLEMLFSGEAVDFTWLSGHNPNYTIHTEQNVNLLGQTGRYFTYEAASTGTGKVEVSYDDPYNSATDEGTIFSASFDIVGFSVSCDNYDSQYDCDGDGNSDDVRIHYSIQCGDPDYDIVLSRREAGTSNSFTQVNTDTVSSSGSHTICDLDAPMDTDYEYKVEVTESNGNGTTDSCTITVFHTQ